ncbi:MAG: hypothetical protein CL917_03305 [Deltaproteobacteria bacterium]|nr:hypothetical protein [Deltaproteobacteria bacterium]
MCDATRAVGIDAARRKREGRASRFREYGFRNYEKGWKLGDSFTRYVRLNTHDLEGIKFEGGEKSD